jgi:ATP-dependent DNA helicase DinG
MKLPFAVPDEPMVQRASKKSNGAAKTPSSYQVPQAVMLFRQGFGRLIRTGSDRYRGRSRPQTENQKYGQTFLESLPPCEVTEQIERLSLSRRR